MRNIALVVALSAAGSGCMSWAGERHPWSLPAATITAPVLERVPAIKLVFLHHTYDEYGVGVDQGNRQFLLDRLTETMKTTPVLRHAAFEPSEPIHYVLLIDTNVNGYPNPLTVLGAATFFLLPMFGTTELDVSAVLYEAANGKEVTRLWARSARETVFWLPLAAAMPFEESIEEVSTKIVDDTYHDVLAHLALNLSYARRLPEAIEPGKLDIQLTQAGLYSRLTIARVEEAHGPPPPATVPLPDASQAAASGK